MAGYILKILLENTHPPVWRRVMTPDRITFADLHEIIQTAFGWEGDHLHDFVTPSRRVTIGNSMAGDEYYDYDEENILVDRFWDSCKWVRYTYDFGDDWQHKIIYEKTDEDYHGRKTVLVKAKGDGFSEDCGGVFRAEDADRIPVDPEMINSRLSKLSFPEKTGEKLEIPESTLEMMRRLTDFFRDTWDYVQTEIQQENISGIESKAEEWKKYAEDWQNVTLVIEQGKKTNEELLNDLSVKEARDYCKYLQIPDVGRGDKKDMIRRIALIFKQHPEYLLYVFYADEYREFRRWSSRKPGEFKSDNRLEDMPVKAIALGLMDAAFTGEDDRRTVTVSFASDLEEILKSLKDIGPVCRWIKRISDKLRNIIVVYGMIEMDALYDMFCRVYKETVSRTDFLRFVYWHARFNNNIQTMYTPDNVAYAAVTSADGGKILKDQMKYADDLEYRNRTEKELKRKAEDIMGEHEHVSYLYQALLIALQMPEPVLQEIMTDIIESIQNGDTLTEIFEECILPYYDEEVIAVTGSIWENLAGAMLTMELPMLKGRSREEYAALKKISPWEIQMASLPEAVKNTKERHMWEFPAELQELMYMVRNHGADGLDDLWSREENERIASEEFLFLLADTCTMRNEMQKAEGLINRLKKSSPRGKRGARFLLQYQEPEEKTEYQELADSLFSGGYPYAPPVSRKPYIRQNPKIGRNDPCPCGSGKKYKRCCGK